MKPLSLIIWSCLFFIFILEASGQVIVLGELSYDYTVMPGNKIKGTIGLQNIGDKEESLQIYQRDYSFNADGENIYGEPGSETRSNALWIRFNPQMLTLIPKEKQDVNYEIDIPADTTLNGTYWSMIMVESQPPPAEKTKGLNVNVVIRYGIQIATTVGPTGKISLKFTNPQLTSIQDKRLFTLDIENAGEQMVRPEIWIELFSLGGSSQGKFMADQRRIYPGMSIRSEWDLSELTAGSYKALVIADCGDENLFGTNLTLEIK